MCLAERGEHDPAARSRLPGLHLGCRARGRDARGASPLDPDADFAPDLHGAPTDDVAAALPQLPVQPLLGLRAARRLRGDRALGRARRAPPSCTTSPTPTSMFDGLAPHELPAEPGAKEVGVEMFSMSKSYGMAGWRLGFVVGNAELVERVNLLQDHVRAGVFRPIQAAGVAALTGPQESVEERRAIYERRRDRVRRVAPGHALGLDVLRLVAPAGGPRRRAHPRRRRGSPSLRARASAPSGSGWARISLATPDERLDAGLARLATALAR